MEEFDIKKEFGQGRSGGKNGFKKKSGGKFNNKKQQSSTVDEFFKGVGFLLVEKVQSCM